jgi:hypothetical protein
MCGRFDEAVKESLALAAAAAIAKDVTAEQMAWLLVGFCREQQEKLDLATAGYDRAVALGPDTTLGQRARAERDRVAARKGER